MPLPPCPSREIRLGGGGVGDGKRLEELLPSALPLDNSNLVARQCARRNTGGGRFAKGEGWGAAKQAANCLRGTALVGGLAAVSIWSANWRTVCPAPVAVGRILFALERVAPGVGGPSGDGPSPCAGVPPPFAGGVSPSWAWAATSVVGAVAGEDENPAVGAEVEIVSPAAGAVPCDCSARQSSRAVVSPSEGGQSDGRHKGVGVRGRVQVVQVRPRGGGDLIGDVHPRVEAVR